MAGARCTVTSRDLFIIILCVATISVLFNFQISYHGTSSLVDQRVEINELFSAEEAHVHTDRYDAKILGRSLNQHETDPQRSRSTEKVTLRSKLAEIESRLLSSRHRVVALQTDKAPTRKEKLLHRLHELDIDVVTKHETMFWVNNDTVVQGNWTVMFCLNSNSCQHTHTKISQKVDRIPELLRLIQTPEVLCSASKMSERISEGKLTNHCEPLKCSKEQINQNMLLVTGNTTRYNFNMQEHCKNEDNFPVGHVWYLPDRPIVFPGGPLLRVQCLVVSLSPLRFYVHQEMLTGSFYAANRSGLLRKSSTEELLQYISEAYGLGTSSRWWMEVQRKLLLYLVSLELEIHRSNRTRNRTCKRCFQPLQIDIVCSTVQFCRILPVTTVGAENMSLSHLKSIKTLVTSHLPVSEDVERILEQMDYTQITEICKGDSEQDDCLPEDSLIYLLDWRREMKCSSQWIPIYPSKFGCKELSKYTLTGSEFSQTFKYMALTRRIGEAFQWTDQTSTELQYTVDGEDDDYMDLRINKQGRYPQGTPGPCSNDSEDFGKLDGIFIHPQVNLVEISPNSYNATVEYDTILVRVHAVSRSCKCQVKLENKYNDPGPRNITLGLGQNKIMIYVVDTMSQDLNIVNAVVINLHRQRRGLDLKDFEERTMQSCALKQDCSLKYDETEPCGLHNLKTRNWSGNGHVTTTKRCTSGDHKGHWVIPCRSCFSNDCFWDKARWRPFDCHYEQFSQSALQQCLRGKKLLFIGDSTNRGVSNYIIEQINGSLYDWDKTHSTRVYTNINNEKTQFTFAYYPHFWLPADHRPRFSKVIYQLIKSSLPLRNDSNTILVVGGVHWLAKQHIDLIIEALQRKGLSGITKVVKGLGAGFHQPIENVKFVPKTDHADLQQRESDILNYAKTKGFHTVATFNMTIARYKDFLEGSCACHFHKVTRHYSADYGYRYKVEGDINAAYSQILLNQICSGA